ncbi:uncharacterized protein LOC135811473 [Sycon ciliatum]|uniref:uncharacterized protein LOC135811473 n=1 Tax=Sycon ciliatum TaxID=27933 RepID=UPI0020A8F026|eukprot:scpid61079/ scgid32585/ 
MTDVIRSAMIELGLDADEVPIEYRIQDVFGSSRSYCSHCHRTWSSHISWVKMDLKTQRVLKNWKQRCLNCSQEVNPYITPEELKRISTLAVKRAQALMNGTFRPMSHARRTSPHNTTTCEKCKYGRRPCWIAKTRPSLSMEQLQNSVDGLATPVSNQRSASPPLVKQYLIDDISSSLAQMSLQHVVAAQPQPRHHIPVGHAMQYQPYGNTAAAATQPVFTTTSTMQPSAMVATAPYVTYYPAAQPMAKVY